jgi:threonine dehydratase
MLADVTRRDVVDAAARIAGLVERTTLATTEIGGCAIRLKCECLQTGGAFKLRGATNRLLQLAPEERERGVVAFSSGNHARGVAIAARRLGMRAVIVMPSDAPRVKVEGTRSEGAEIVFYDRGSESREAIAGRIAADTGATVVPSFDDPAIVAGQGAVGIARRPYHAYPAMVDEDDYDDWFDFDNELPAMDPNPLQDGIPLTDWPWMVPPNEDRPIREESE